MSVFRVASLAALALTTACVSNDYGYAPQYPPGYDSGMGSGLYYQQGDLFGGQNVADVRVFYEPLAQYGDWTQSQFGYAFRPRVDQNWRPYVNGRWGENRLWLSNDPWGWATDHYGRWGYDQRIGWVWVPGTEWAPSWVAWREDDQQDVAGWAPVPPGVAYSFGVGFGSALAYNAWNDWYAPSWVWVPRRNLYAPGFGGTVLPWRYGQNYWRGSHWNHQPGWNGRPGYGRPDYGRPGYARPGYDNRPPGWTGNGRPPEGNAGRPTNAYPNGRPRDDQYQRPPRNAYGQPGNVNPGGNAQGRPPRDGNGNWQGRPPGGDTANAPPPRNGQRPTGGRPPQGSAINAGNRPPGTPPPQRPAYAAAPGAPPVTARPAPAPVRPAPDVVRPAPDVARPAPPPRAERPSQQTSTPRPSRNSNESVNEQPQ